MKLEIIMPHYNEPWEVCEPFFRMLSLQRGVSFSDILVTVVQDGEEGRIDFRKKTAQMPFRVRQINIPHSGVSAARNTGLRDAMGEWITFCDCDDCFSTIYSLQWILEVLDDDQNDLLWTPFLAEMPNKDGKLTVQARTNRNMVWTHMKFFRLKFLRDHPELQFNESLNYSEDSAFNALVDMVIDQKRVAKISTPMVVYTWSYREGSATTDKSKRLANSRGIFHRNLYVTDEYRKRGFAKSVRGMIGRTTTDMYFHLTQDNMQEGWEELEEEFWNWFRKHRKAYASLDKAVFDRVYAASKREAYWLDEGKTVDRPGIDAWLEGLVKKYGNEGSVD